MADTADSKSADLTVVRVRLPPRARQTFGLQDDRSAFGAFGTARHGPATSGGTQEGAGRPTAAKKIRSQRSRRLDPTAGAQPRIVQITAGTGPTAFLRARDRRAPVIRCLRSAHEATAPPRGHRGLRRVAGTSARPLRPRPRTRPIRPRDPGERHLTPTATPPAEIRRRVKRTPKTDGPTTVLPRPTEL